MITWAGEGFPPAERVAYFSRCLIGPLLPTPFPYGRTICEAFNFTNHFSQKVANLR
jgi:hypothetical protein